MAEVAHLARRRLERRFREATGRTIGEHLARERVKIARRLLTATTLKHEAVAARSGFASAGRMRKVFLRVLNATPEAYRRKAVGPA